MKLSWAVVGLLILAGSAGAQTVWTGPEINFTKPDGADWTLPENQDRITDNVWLTRQDFGGIYNIAVEAAYTKLSPADTEWAYGDADDYENLTFDTWVNWAAHIPPGTVGQDAVVHLISEDIYIDIMFTSWGIGIGGGGAFSYERTTAPEPSSNTDFDSDGDTDGADFILWQRGYDPSCTTCTLSDGDSDGDNDVDEVDLANWEANYGTVASPITAASTAVPEPATWFVLLFGVMAMLFRRDVVVS